MKHKILSTPLFLFILLASLLLSACATATPAPAAKQLAGQAPSTATTEPPAPSSTPLPTHTAAPTSTPEPTASPTPEPPPANLPDAQLFVMEIKKPQEKPTDLLEHLFFYQVGGASGGFGGEKADNKPPYWASSYKEEVIDALPQNLTWRACRLTGTTTPQAFLTSPDGSTTSPQVNPDKLSTNCFIVEHPFLPGSLLGKYGIRLVQGNTELVDSVTLEWPTKPIRTYYQGKHWFAGFKPGEAVTITIFSQHDIFNKHSKSELAEVSNDFGYFQSSTLFLINQQLILADKYGLFQIEIKSEIPLPEDLYISAYGETSGEVQRNKNWVYDYDPNWALYCGTLPVRLHKGDFARIITIKDHLNSLTIATDRIVQVPAGTTVKMLSGPFCIEHGWAWLVELPDKSHAILPESSDYDYYLEPVNP